jgi:hypothetical protein
LLLLLVGCTSVTLEVLPPDVPVGPDDRLTVTGEVCTSPPDSLSWPRRVLFLVDGSESMRLSDPPDPITGETGRERAVRVAAEALLAEGETEISVVRFSGNAQPLTRTVDADGTLVSHFTADMGSILAALPLLAETDRTTGFLGALSEAYAQIRHEIDRTSRDAWPRASFEVVLLSDGLPDTESGDLDGMLAVVDDIVSLEEVHRLSRVGVSTVQLETGNLAVDLAAGQLLEQLADAGDGTFRGFASGGSLDLVAATPPQVLRAYTLSELVAWNLQARVRADGFDADTDGDGLTDVEELTWGADPRSPDSDGDGCRDALEVSLTASGLDPMDPTDCGCAVAAWCVDEDADGLCDGDCVDEDADGRCDCDDIDADGVCDPSNYADADGDGLVDCEERWTGTSPRAADTDIDGLVDLHEVRFGTRPDVDDAREDADWDAVSDGDEVRSATDPRTAAARRFEQAYRYELEQIGWRDGASCHAFTVDNITLVDVEDPTDRTHRWPGGQGASGWNRVLVFAHEVPLDGRDAPGRFRVACVEAAVDTATNARNPPSGRLSLTDDDFVPLPELDPAIHCVHPRGSADAGETEEVD